MAIPTPGGWQDYREITVPTDGDSEYHMPAVSVFKNNTRTWARHIIAQFAYLEANASAEYTSTWHTVIWTDWDELRCMEQA